MSIPDDIVIADQREALAALAAEVERLGAVATQYAKAIGDQRAEVERLRSRLAIAEDGWHQANGVAHLAMKHRDMAEQRLAAADALLKDIRNVGIVQGTSDRIDAHLAGAGIVGTVMLKP
jgi:hypothetical protein